MSVISHSVIVTVVSPFHVSPFRYSMCRRFDQLPIVKIILLSLVAIVEGPVRLRVPCNMNIRGLQGLASSHHFIDELPTDSHFIPDSVRMRT